MEQLILIANIVYPTKNNLNIISSQTSIKKQSRYNYIQGRILYTLTIGKTFIDYHKLSGAQKFTGRVNSRKILIWKCH